MRSFPKIKNSINTVVIEIMNYRQKTLLLYIKRYIIVNVPFKPIKNFYPNNAWKKIRLNLLSNNNF